MTVLLALALAVFPTEPLQARPEQFNAAIAEAAAAQGLVGYAAAYVEGREIHAFFGGHEDRERGVEVGPATMFRWASISKPLASVAAMQLAQDGKLDLDADIRVVLPEFPKKPWPVTARQLTGHLGGIVHYTNGKVIRTQAEYDVTHPFKSVILALDRFKDSPLIAEPGTKYAYSTHGYILLSAVIERAGGAPFADQVHARILRPLGMTTCRPDYQWEDIAHRAVGYRKIAGKVIPSTNTDVSWKLAGGGYVSTIQDLALFARSLTGEKLLSRKALGEMWTPMKTESGKSTGYGMGFGVRREGDRLRVSHSGAQEKTRTLLQVFPDEGRAMVFMTNSEYAKPGEILKAAWTAIE